MPLRARCVDGLGPHRAAWDELVERSPLPSPFLRSWWLDAVRVDAPAFVLVLAGDELLGGVALEVRRRIGVAHYRHIGDLLGDHLDLVVQRGREAVVVRALQDWWTRPGNRVLEVDYGASLDGLLGNAFPAGAAVGVGMSAPYTALPSDFEELLDGLPGQLRSTIKRSTRRLEREGVVHRVVDDPADVDRALDDLRTLHDAVWNTQSRFLPEFARFAAAAHAGVAAGEVVFNELVHEGRVIATEVDLEVAGRTSFYQAGRLEDRRWQGAGTVLKAKVVQRACDRGHREYDLLRGAEPYKDAWASGSRTLARIRAHHGPTASAAVKAQQGARLARAARARLLAARPRQDAAR